MFPFLAGTATQLKDVTTNNTKAPKYNTRQLHPALLIYAVATGLTSLLMHGQHFDNVVV